MKTKILFVLLCASTVAYTQTTPSSSDSTKALFKAPKYSYMQWDFGYANDNTKEQSINAFEANFLGFVFNDKWFTSMGVTAWSDQSQNQNNYITSTPQPINTYVSIYFNNEFLITPKNVINFSIPIKIAYTGITGWDTIYSPESISTISNWNFTGKNYYQNSGGYWSIEPGANIFVNIFKGLSLGVGANYRFAFGTSKDIGTNSNFSSYSILAFVRLKLDTKAMNKKMLENQKEYLKNLQGH